ncbi:unannotated protein [freshwater metagenome]|uniref:Unannotated protein n=1 Tax=freshwater metagenome TaxID=449393 RepID=A0A6J7EUQ9_9ZZZZ
MVAMSSRPLDEPVLRIRPRRGFASLNLGSLWTHRELLQRFTGRDLTLRYRQTALGVIWVVLQPLLGAGAFSFVFGAIAGFSSSGGTPYFVFAFAGLTAWGLFYNVLTRASGSLVANAPLVSKVFFPRLILPCSTVGSSLVDFAVALVMLAVLVLIGGASTGWALLTLPLWVAVIIAQALGIGVLLSALMVRYRDVQYVLPVASQLLLFASPVAYTLAAVSHRGRAWLQVNPLTGVLEAFRWSTLGGQEFPVSALYSAGWAVVLVLGGFALFARMERQFADVI